MTRGHNTVLLVNYNPDERGMYRQALVAAGMDVIVCVDPLDAFNVAVARRPAAVVTRVRHPNAAMDGIQLTRQLKANSRTADVHVVITMSLIDTPRRMEAFEAGCDECLMFPSECEDVVEAVRRARSPDDAPHQPYV